MVDGSRSTVAPPLAAAPRSSPLRAAAQRERPDGGRLAGATGFYWLVVGLAVALAVAARAQYLGSPDFPLGEGGLFVTFSEAIEHNHFRLPYYVQYGGAVLPFAYPPAAFYIAALVSHFTGLSLFSAYYVLPIGLNLLAAPAFAWLAAAHARDRVEFVCATLLYAAVPESFVWQITGGGAPRALAALFTLVAAGWALRTAPAPRARDAVGIGVAVGLAALSHLEWGLTAAVAVSLALVTRQGWRRTLRLLPVVAVAAAAVVAPWLATVLGRHGLAPFQASSSASQWDFQAFLARALSAHFLVGLLTWPALIGLAARFRQRDLFAFAWAVLMLLTTPRMALASGLAIPAALLAGQGLACLGAAGRRARGASGRRKAWLSYSLTALICLALILPFLPSLFIEFQVTRQLRPEWRAAMGWIAGHTPPTARFVVVTDAYVWWEDSTAEWFPALTSRASLTTAQGLEWLAPGAFTHELDAIATLKAVQRAPPKVLFQYLQGAYCDADYVAVFSKGVADATTTPPPGFAVVHRAADSAVLQRVGAKRDCAA